MVNLPCLLGLTPFAGFAPLWRSPPMAVIFLLGSAFHTFPTSNFLFALDTCTNVSLVAVGTTQHEHIKFVMLVMAIMFLYNRRFDRDDPWVNARHVVSVQWMGFIAFYMLYRADPCNPYFFACNKSV